MSNTRSRILQHALELATTVGFDSFSYADLARLLDVSKASIHHHFPKKEDLGLALCEDARMRVAECFEAIMASSPSPLKQLDGYFKVVRNASEGCRKVCIITSLQGSSEVISDTMVASIKTIGNMEVEFVAAILKEGKKCGEITFHGDAKAQATMVCATINGAFQYGSIQGEASFDSIITQLKSSLLGSNSTMTSKKITLKEIIFSIEICNK